ncbi:hypothetical protein GGI35DRAFT_367573 [Trichoderma velutinum]
MASALTRWPSDGEISLSHIIGPSPFHLEQMDDSVEYLVPAQQPGSRKSRIARQRAPLACTACRSQHAKCSGESPKCNRCLVEQRHCQYPKSRRKRASLTPLSPMMTNFQDNNIFKSHFEEDTLQQLSGTLVMSSATEWPDWPESVASEMISPSMDLSPTITTPSCFSAPISQFLDAYYDYFHKSHPIAPARRYVNSLIQSNSTIAISMLYGIQYVGALYLKAPTAEEFQSLTLQHINSNSFDAGPQQIYQVSATLMLTIALYGQGESTEARRMLARAISQSTSIGMSHKDLLIHQPDQELVELWKSIYWYLYVTSALMSNMDGDLDSLLFSPALDFPLPHDEDVDLSSATIKNTDRKWSLEDYDASDFDESPAVFSSFTYLVALVRISRSIHELHKLPPEQLERASTCIDARLMNWTARLPPWKRKAVGRNGELDDIMFQAHMLSYSLSIDIHTLLLGSESQATDMFHAKKVVEAAEAALGLLTLYTCPLLMSPLSISHISKCTLACLRPMKPKRSSNIRDYVSLSLGSLQQLCANWTIASQAAQTIRYRARCAYVSQGISDISSCTTSEPPADITQIQPTWT